VQLSSVVSAGSTPVEGISHIYIFLWEANMKITNEINSHIRKTDFYITNILNSTDILMRGGKDQRVSEGQYFNILEEPTQIIDPNTKKILGTTYRYKYRMQVIKVFPNISRLTTTRKNESSFATRFVSSSPSPRKKPMRTASGQHVDDVFADFSYSAVKVGDYLLPDDSLDFGVRYYPH